jgi:hypothetical protein
MKAIALLTTFAFSACGQTRLAPDVSVSAALSQFLRQDEQRISLRRCTDFKWEAAYLFGPYMPYKNVRETLGFEWPEYKKFGLDSAENFYLLVFTSDGKVLRAEQIYRNVADFELRALGQKLTPQVIFRVRRNEGRVPILSVEA